ncbi:MAG: hypothetical protein HPY66_2353 [Firmicutes bacterium]|nr:hypothetical protein [Bacillota bacterium]
MIREARLSSRWLEEFIIGKGGTMTIKMDFIIKG